MRKAYKRSLAKYHPDKATTQGASVEGVRAQRYSGPPIWLVFGFVASGDCANTLSQWLENSASDLRLVSQAVRAEEIYKLLQNRFSTWEEEQARRGAAATYRGW